MKLIVEAFIHCEQRPLPIALFRQFRRETGRWPAYRLLPLSRRLPRKDV